MRDLLILIFSSILFISCGPTLNVSNDLASQIPNGANAIKIYSNESSFDLFRSIRFDLQYLGFEIIEENLETKEIVTDYDNPSSDPDAKPRTALQIEVHIIEENSESIAIFTGKGIKYESAPTEENPYNLNEETYSIYWGEDIVINNKFGELASIANKINHTNLEYEKNK